MAICFFFLSFFFFFLCLCIAFFFLFFFLTWTLSQKYVNLPLLRGKSKSNRLHRLRIESVWYHDFCAISCLDLMWNLFYLPLLRFALHFCTTKKRKNKWKILYFSYKCKALIFAYCVLWKVYIVLHCAYVVATTT